MGQTPSRYWARSHLRSTIIRLWGQHIAGPLGHLWSLSVEEHCYIVLALLAFSLKRDALTAAWICLTLAFVAMANGAYLYHAGAGYVHEIYWRTDVRLAPIFLSAGIYLITRRLELRHQPPVALWFAVAIASFALFSPLPLKMIGPTLALAWAINMVDFSSEKTRASLSGRWLTFAGTISFSLYLWQQPFYKVFDGAGWSLLPAFVLALASYAWIEKPARTWLNALANRKRHALAIR